jgi:hypothetical protein
MVEGAVGADPEDPEWLTGDGKGEEAWLAAVEAGAADVGAVDTRDRWGTVTPDVVSAPAAGGDGEEVDGGDGGASLRGRTGLGMAAAGRGVLTPRVSRRTAAE